MEEPRFMAMETRLVVHLPSHSSPGPKWAPVHCATKASYGCGYLADDMLQGLTLYMRRRRRPGASDLNSSLSIGLSRLALESIKDELGMPSEFPDCLPEVYGSIMIVDQGLLVLIVSFLRRNHGERVYYLVHDAGDASLYMVPYIPWDLEATITATPVPARPAGGGEGHELVLLARKFWPQPHGEERGRICVCSPATRSKSNPTDGSTASPWAIKEHRFPDLVHGFSADAAFSSGDKVFWGDLSQGVAHSERRDGGADDSAVFVELPRGYRIDFHVVSRYDQPEAAETSRTMGCVEGSVKFACICRKSEHHRRRPGNEVVKVWTLDLDRKLWKEDEGFPCLWKDLWKQACDKNTDLRHVRCQESQNPVLTSDGALTVLLPKMILRRCGDMEADYICSFDIASKRCLCFGRVRDYHSIWPLILPRDFFISLERKLPTPKRKLSSIVVSQAPRRRPASVRQRGRVY